MRKFGTLTMIIGGALMILGALASSDVDIGETICAFGVLMLVFLVAGMYPAKA